MSKYIELSHPDTIEIGCLILLSCLIVFVWETPSSYAIIHHVQVQQEIGGHHNFSNSVGYKMEGINYTHEELAYKKLPLTNKVMHAWKTTNYTHEESAYKKFHSLIKSYTHEMLKIKLMKNQHVKLKITIKSSTTKENQWKKTNTK